MPTYTLTFQNGVYNAFNKADPANPLFSSQSYADTFNFLLGTGGLAQLADEIEVDGGSVDKTCYVNVNGVTVRVLGLLTALTNTGLTDWYVLIVNGNNVLLLNGTINGNGLSMDLAPDLSLNHGNISAQIFSGVSLRGTSDVVKGMTVYNCRGDCVDAWSTGNLCGFVSCVLHDAGANVITLSGNSNYAIGCDVSRCSDVGITTWDGVDCIISNNKVHDINAANQTMVGWAGGDGFGNGSFWGVGVENSGGGSGAGLYGFVSGNQIYNISGFGIVVNRPNVLIAHNNFKDIGWVGVQLMGNATGCDVDYNTFENMPFAISNEVSGNNQYQNTFINTVAFYDGSAGGTPLPMTNNPPATATISVLVSGNGMVSPFGQQIREIGSQLTVNVTNGILNHWDLSGSDLGSNSTVTVFVKPETNGMVLTAVFDSTETPPMPLWLPIAIASVAGVGAYFGAKKLTKHKKKRR